MITVILYGHLAEQFGKRHRLEISTPAEAIRAMCANYKTFRAAIMQDGQAAYRVMAGSEDRGDEAGLHLPAGKAKTIKVIPVIAGANGGFGKILLGAALIAGAYFLGPALATSSLTGSAYTAAEFGLSALSSVGFSLALGGVSSMLFSPPKQASGGTERAENRPSYSFNGPINTIGQGNCVPLCYGRMRVGSQVISASTETVNL